MIAGWVGGNNNFKKNRKHEKQINQIEHFNQKKR